MFSLKDQYIQFLMEEVDAALGAWQIAHDAGKVKRSAKLLARAERYQDELNLVWDEPRAAVSRYIREEHETYPVVHQFVTLTFECPPMREAYKSNRLVDCNFAYVNRPLPIEEN